MPRTLVCLVALLLSLTASFAGAEVTVIAHRGASAQRPEHTAAAYELAIEQGADFIEPDLVMTKDGVLVARHENKLDDTTNVASLDAFADRKTTKNIDGKEITGWFTEDFTLAELEELRTRERLPNVRPDNTEFDGQQPILTLAEILDIASKAGVGVYPELKHPGYFDSIGLPMEQALVDQLADFGGPVFIQSFELSCLQKLDAMTDRPLIYLVGESQQGELDSAVLGIVSRFVDGVGVDKKLITPEVARAARSAGLELHAWTLRPEPQFLIAGADDMQAEFEKLKSLGVTGVFTDAPRQIQRQVSTLRPANLIVMIADGGGANTLQSTRYWTGKPLVVDSGDWQRSWVAPFALRGDQPGEGLSPGEQVPAWIYDSEKNYDDRRAVGERPGTGEVPGRLYPRGFAGYEWNRDFRPDSANTMTALMTGTLTYPGAINVDGNAQPVTSIAELAKERGKKVGVVSSVQWNHATPASAAGAHNPRRDDYHGLARQILEAKIPDVLAGPNNPDFDEGGQPVGEGRPNGKYMPLPLWDQVKAGETDWTLVQDADAIRDLAKGDVPEQLLIVPKVLRTLQQKRPSGGNAQQTAPGEDARLSTVPSLSDLARAALNAIDDDDDGFFLMVEGGAVDWAMHDNQLGRMIEEHTAFDETVKVVSDYLDAGTNGHSWDNTLVIVTADHDHLLFGPDATTQAYQPVTDNGAGQMPGHTWLFDHHSNQLVPLFARGAGSEAILELAGNVDEGQLAGQPVGRGRYMHQAKLGEHLKSLLSK